MEEQKFHSVSVKVVEEIIKNIPSIKSSEGGIPIKILKQSGFTNQILTDCINDVNNKALFPDSLKIANTTEQK